MAPTQSIKAMAAVTAIGVFAGVVISSGQVRAWDADSPWLGDARVIQGFKIAPVPLNLARKNKALVGLGSYLVPWAAVMIAIPQVLRPNSSSLLETHIFLALRLAGAR